MRPLCVGLTAALAIAGPATARADWTAPATIGEAAPSVESQQLALDPGGSGIAAWRDITSTSSSLRRIKQISYAWRLPDGSFTPPRTTGDGFFLGGAAMSARAGALLFVGHRVGSRRERLEAWTGFPGRPLLRAQIVDRSSRPYFTTPLLAADQDGDAVAVWTNGIGAPRRTVYIAVRVRGRRFQRPRRISALGASNFSVAMAPNGRYVVAWLRAGGVEARVGKGSRLSHVFQIAHLSKVLGYLPLSPAIDSAGDSAIAWSYRGLRLTYRPAGRRFGPARRLAGPSTARALTFVSREHEALVWQDQHGLVVADLVRGMSVTTTRLPLEPQPDMQDWFQSLAVGPQGQIAVAWTVTHQDMPGLEPTPLWVSYRPAAGMFGDPERVNEPTDDAISATVAFSGNSVVALWTAESVLGDPASPDIAETATRR